MIGAIGSLRKDKIPSDMVVKKESPLFEIHEEDQKEFGQLGKDTTKYHLILDMARVGGRLFTTKLEYTYFAPRKGSNHLFEMIMLKWPKEGLLWSIISFPIEYKERAIKLAEECGLRIADGIPHLFDKDGAHSFPFDGETVFTLENCKDHPIYKNYKNRNIEQLKAEETAECDAIINEDKKDLIKDMQSEGFVMEQIERLVNNWENGGMANENPAGKKNV